MSPSKVVARGGGGGDPLLTRGALKAGSVIPASQTSGNEQFYFFSSISFNSLMASADNSPAPA